MSRSFPKNQIVQADCIASLGKLPAGSVDLAFADPPFNIGFSYDVYDDRRERDAYLDWSQSWIGAVHRVLKPDGTFWLAIGDEYAAELKLCSQEIGFHCRSWVIWYYTFGVNCKSKFSRSHAHLFYFVKDPEQFTFAGDELENRIPSARQLVYADSRANPTGRLPDDTWVLRPQDLADCFTTAEDTWYFPRVAGTFKERAGFHGCQMPEQLMGRIIRLCSRAGELVLDPFSGSATTLAVAKKLGRNYLGFDISTEYVDRGQARLREINVGDALEGAAEPTVSAPATPNGKKRSKTARDASVSETTLDQATTAELARFQAGLVTAFREASQGFSLDRVIADPAMNEQFAAACRVAGLPGEARTWNEWLLRLRKRGALTEVPATKRTEIAWEACEPYRFACELAWRQLQDEADSPSLDAILCDPELAKRFDALAQHWAPGHSPLEYRWVALKLRKSARTLSARANLLTDLRLSRPAPLEANNESQIPNQAGVFLLLDEEGSPLYAGEAANLRERLQLHVDPERRALWPLPIEAPQARYSTTDTPCITRLAYRHRLVKRLRPRFNLWLDADAPAERLARSPR